MQARGSASCGQLKQHERQLRCPQTRSCVCCITHSRACSMCCGVRGCRRVPSRRESVQARGSASCGQLKQHERQLRCPQTRSCVCCITHSRTQRGAGAQRGAGNRPCMCAACMCSMSAACVWGMHGREGGRLTCDSDFLVLRDVAQRVYGLPSESTIPCDVSIRAAFMVDAAAESEHACPTGIAIARCRIRIALPDA